PVRRYELPNVQALNFVLPGILRGGVTRSLALDAHGKCLGSALLDLDLAIHHSCGSGLAREGVVSVDRLID
ncbi:MAG: hypothetical protein PHH99_18760, partial [Pseudomonas fluorescens]|nr:hypothetical protein [Pseudomonas fluorescens]